MQCSEDISIVQPVSLYTKCWFLVSGNVAYLMFFESGEQQTFNLNFKFKLASSRVNQNFLFLTSRYVQKSRLREIRAGNEL
jgi:hypothetical protein